MGLLALASGYKNMLQSHQLRGYQPDRPLHSRDECRRPNSLCCPIHQVMISLKAVAVYGAAESVWMQHSARLTLYTWGIYTSLLASFLIMAT